MGVTATTRLPAGWYPDPEGGDGRRWWDGQEWTRYTAAFQRYTSVDEVDLGGADTGPTEQQADAAVTSIESKKARGAAPIRVVAERLGRWVAGAVHLRPSARKRRGAHRSSR